MGKHHGLMLIAVALVATACSGEDIAERIAENRIEAEGGGDVDIDLDGGNFSVKTEDGEFSIQTDSDGNVSIQGAGENGDESFTIESENGETVFESEDGTAVFSQSGDLPDGFPDSIPLPDDFAVLYAQSTEAPEGTAYSVVGTTPASIVDVTGGMQTDFLAAGYEQGELTPAVDGAIVVFTADDHEVLLVIGPGADGDTSVTMNVTPVG